MYRSGWSSVLLVPAWEMGPNCPSCDSVFFPVCVRRLSIWGFKFSAACLQRSMICSRSFFVTVKIRTLDSDLRHLTQQHTVILHKDPVGSVPPPLCWLQETPLEKRSQVVTCARLRGSTGEGQRIILKTWRAGRDKGKNGDNPEDTELNQTQSMAEAVMQILLPSIYSINSLQVQCSSTSKFSMYRPFLLTLNGSLLDWNQLSIHSHHEWDYIAPPQCECPRCGQFDHSSRKQSICHQVNWQVSRCNPVKWTEYQNTWKW